MNQILLSNKLFSKDISSTKKNAIERKKYKYYIFLFSFFLSMLLIFFGYLCLYLYNINVKEKNAQNLSNFFSLKTMYNNIDHKANQLLLSKTSTDPFVIGVIKIDKIKLDYPILSYADDESLKIAPCRFAGPKPNEIGNLCIAGHNYADNSFFGKLKILNPNDSIKIYDLDGIVVEYRINVKTEVESTDLKYVSQNTNNKRIVTLFTCNTLKNTRLVLAAEEVL